MISVLGDEPCYFFNKREDEGHISAELVDPASHVAHLERSSTRSTRAWRIRAPAAVHRPVLPDGGPRPARGTAVPGAPAAYQTGLFEALRGLARERIDEGVHDGLGAIARIRSRLLLDGDLAGLLALGRRADAFALDARVRNAAWTNGRLLIEYRAALSQGPGGSPLTLVERDDATYLDPAVAEDLVGPIDVTDELGSIRAQLVARRPGDVARVARQRAGPSRSGQFGQGTPRPRTAASRRSPSAPASGPRSTRWPSRALPSRSSVAPGTC